MNLTVSWVTTLLLSTETAVIVTVPNLVFWPVIDFYFPQVCCCGQIFFLTRNGGINFQHPITHRITILVTHRVSNEISTETICFNIRIIPDADPVLPGVISTRLVTRAGIPFAIVLT